MFKEITVEDQELARTLKEGFWALSALLYTMNVPTFTEPDLDPMVELVFRGDMYTCHVGRDQPGGERHFRLYQNQPELIQLYHSRGWPRPDPRNLRAISRAGRFLVEQLCERYPETREAVAGIIPETK